MRLFLLLSSFLVSFIFFACKKDKLKSPPASFIVVNSPSVSSGISSRSDTHKITDIWLYVNEQFQGIYPVGSVMPILSSGNTEIKIYGGIKNNGISETRLPYKFYSALSFNGNFESHQTYTINPVFNYVSGIDIQDDNFNTTNGSIYMPAGDSYYTVTNDPAKAWGGSGGSVFMTMSDSKPTAIIQSSSAQILPLGGADVYLELDYKCNQEITVGVICGANIEERTALNLRPTDSWNKIYISLTSAVSTQPTYNYYKIFIKGVKQSGLANPEIYLDNIRLIKPL